MKLNTNNGLFIQETDVKTVHDINCGLPRYVGEEIQEQYGFFHPGVDDRFFHCFKNSESISFFNNIDFLLDYDYVKELTNEQINEMLTTLNSEYKELLEEKYYAIVKRKPYNAEKSKKIKAKEHFYNELKYYSDNKEQIDRKMQNLLDTQKNTKTLVKN